MKETTEAATETADLYKLARQLGGSVDLRENGDVFLIGPGTLPGRLLGANVKEAVETLRSIKSGASKSQLHARQSG